MFVMRALLWPASGKASALRDALLATAKAGDQATQAYQQRLTPLLATPLEAPDWFEILTSPA